MDIAVQVEKLSEVAILWAPKLISAILILIIGFWIVGRVMNVIGKRMDKAKMDRDVQPFLKSMLGVLLKVLVVITAAGVVGIEVTAFAALLAAAGLAIGMALQGTLGHFASGVMILIFKPYRVGDLVDLQGQVGHVKEIQIFNTILTSLDHKKVIIPNGIATSGIMTNLSEQGKLRVDLQVSVPYEEDLDRMKQLIRGAVDTVTDRLPDEPTIEVHKFGEHNLVMDVRPYAAPEKYWDVYYATYSAIKKAFAQNNVPVAYEKKIQIAG